MAFNQSQNNFTFATIGTLLKILIKACYELQMIKLMRIEIFFIEQRFFKVFFNF